MRELRSVLDAARPGLQITFDITASVPTYDIAALTADDAADAVFLMAYDFIGNSADHAASHSPLDDPVNHFDIRTTVAELLGVADPAHTILGLPWYGRAWTTKGPEAFSPTRSGKNLTGPGFSWYEDAVSIARDNGRNWDPVARPPGPPMSGRPAIPARRHGARSGMTTSMASASRPGSRSTRGCGVSACGHSATPAACRGCGPSST